MSWQRQSAENFGQWHGSIAGREERLDLDLIERARSTVKAMRAHYRSEVLLGIEKQNYKETRLPSEQETKRFVNATQSMHIDAGTPANNNPSMLQSDAIYKNICSAHSRLLPRRFGPEYRKEENQNKHSVLSPMAREKAAAAGSRRLKNYLDPSIIGTKSKEAKSAFGAVRAPHSSPARRYYHVHQNINSIYDTVPHRPSTTIRQALLKLKSQPDRQKLTTEVSAPHNDRYFFEIHEPKDRYIPVSASTSLEKSFNGTSSPHYNTQLRFRSNITTASANWINKNMDKSVGEKLAGLRMKGQEKRRINADSLGDMHKQIVSNSSQSGIIEVPTDDDIICLIILEDDEV